tara:strand:+ start:51 stop:392 length:342 start_codon:yes stop_codon:yes gene_type:complete
MGLFTMKGTEFYGKSPFKKGEDKKRTPPQKVEKQQVKDTAATGATTGGGAKREAAERRAPIKNATVKTDAAGGTPIDRSRPVHRTRGKGPSEETKRRIDEGRVRAGRPRKYGK